MSSSSSITRRVVVSMLPLAITLAAVDAHAGPESAAWTKRSRLWVWHGPTSKSERVGYLRAGVPFRLRDTKGTSGPGCRGEYLPLVPRGYVCSDDVQLGAPGSAPEALLAPTDAALPFSYAISNGAPMYTRLPTEDEWKQAERWLGAAGTFKRYPWNEKHERLARVATIAAADPAPSHLTSASKRESSSKRKLVQRLVPLGSMIAYTRAFEHGGRSWLLSSDGLVVPADRVRPYERSRYHGVEIAGDVRLPIALLREDAVGYVLDDEAPREAAARWTARSWTPLDATTAPRTLRGKTYVATRRSEGGQRVWVERGRVAVVEPLDELPAVVAGDEAWISVRISERLLVAFEGKHPRFATLISPGAGGVQRKGQDPLKASTTPLGTYRIQYKHSSQTMSPDKGKPRDEWQFWFSEVPRAQYFDVPFALHTAYWHEDFGQFMSAGCVNLSPADGDWLFEWTHPRLPPGWGGVWAGHGNGAGTRLIIGR